MVLMMPCKMTGGRCLVLGMMLCGLMSWGRLWRSGFAATRSSEGCAAECKAGKSENRKLFESFVHNTPSLSSFVLMRIFLAAYIKIGVVGVIF